MPRGIFFCDVCGESVPDRDIEIGQARKKGAHVLCAAHAAAIATVPRPRVSWPLSAALVALGAAAALLVRSLLLPGVEPGDLDAIEERQGAAVAGVAESVRRAVESSALSAEEGRAAMEALASRIAALEDAGAESEGRLRSLAERLAAAEGARTAAASVEDEEARLIDAELESIRRDVDAVRGEVERLSLSAAAAPTSETPPAAPLDAPERPLALDRDAFRRQLVAADAAVRFSALVELAKRFGAGAAAEIAIALSDADPFIRAYAARLLGDYASHESVRDLLVALRDPEIEVREAAARSVREIAGTDFGFEPSGPEDGRLRAIRRVEDWWRAETSPR